MNRRADNHCSGKHGENRHRFAPDSRRRVFCSASEKLSGTKLTALVHGRGAFVLDEDLPVVIATMEG